MDHEDDILKEEHSRLVISMNGISQDPGKTGKAFSEVLKIFRYHLDREEGTVIPLLSYLKERMCKGGRTVDDSLVTAADNLSVELESMLEEHRQIEDLLGRIMDLPKEKQTEMALEIVAELRHHVALEEQMLYPAAMAATELIKLKKKTC